MFLKMNQCANFDKCKTSVKAFTQFRYCAIGQFPCVTRVRRKAGVITHS